jgi:hypothetical protein
MAQVVEHSRSKHKALSSIPHTAKSISKKMQPYIHYHTYETKTYIFYNLV